MDHAQHVSAPSVRIRATWLSRKPDALAGPIAVGTWLVVGFITALYWRDLFHARTLLAATRAQVFEHGELWRLWTAAFVHADLGHLAANSLLFLTLGYLLAGYFGRALFPVAALICAGVINAISIATYPPNVQLVGASGVVCWLGGAWLSLYVGLARHLRLSQRCLRAAGVALALFAPTEAFDPQVSYRTHGVGFVLGLLCGFIYFKLGEARFRAAEVVEVEREDLNTPPPPAIEDEAWLDDEADDW